MLVPSQIHLNQDFIRKMYLDENLTKKELVELCHCTISQLNNILSKNGIKKPMDKQIECRRRGCMAKYGVDNPSKAQEIKDKKVKTCREHFGVDFSLQSKEVREKGKETIKALYGVEYISQSSKIQEKIKATNLKNYGTEHYVNPQKARETCLEKYGKRSYTQTEEYLERVRQTNLERYGCECVSQNEEVKNKMKKTNLIRYGSTCTLASEEINQKIIEKYSQEQDKNVTHFSQLSSVRKKVVDAKRKNGTFNTSKSEQEVKKMLEERFSDVKCQYWSERYPFSCDFYIPLFDLYIEYQGTWTHGKRPFDESDEFCLKELEFWKEKAKTSKFYQNAIEVWTKTDPLKRRTAKQNKLNWIEFFNMQEFTQWISAKGNANGTITC